MVVLFEPKNGLLLVQLQRHYVVPMTQMNNNDIHVYNNFFFTNCIDHDNTCIGVLRGGGQGGVAPSPLKIG